MATRPSAFFFFNCSNQGWSERYWYFDPAAPLADVATEASALLVLRSKMFPAAVDITWGYVSYDDELRDVLPINLPSKDDMGLWNAGITSKPLEPNVTMVVRCFSSSNRAGKYIYLSGIPVTGVVYPPLRPVTFGTDAFETAFIGYKGRLQNGKWGWKSTSYGGGGPSATITAMVAGVSEWTITTNNTTGFLPGKNAKISGVKFSGTSPNNVNSVYQVTSVTAPNTIVVAWGAKDFSGITYVGGGLIEQAGTGILVIDRVAPEKLGTRKRGVGFGRQLGRRRRRV